MRTFFWLLSFLAGMLLFFTLPLTLVCVGGGLLVWLVLSQTLLGLMLLGVGLMVGVLTLTGVYTLSRKSP